MNSILDTPKKNMKLNETILTSAASIAITKGITAFPQSETTGKTNKSLAACTRLLVTGKGEGKN